MKAAKGTTTEASAGGPDAAGSSDRVEALCERIRQLAESSSADSLDAARRQADERLQAARAEAEALLQTRVAAARQRLEKQFQRDLQDVRLAARSRLDVFRWDALTGVLDEAERAVQRVREEDAPRYYAALARFVGSARRQLESQHVVVAAAAEDVPALRRQLADETIEFVETDVGGGVVVSTPDGNCFVDHSFARRRQRLDATLRLAAGELLFADLEPSQDDQAARPAQA